MNIVAVGLNHRTAPLELREKFSFNEQDAPGILRKLVDSRHVLEGVVVGTCNRTEIYAVVDREKKRLDLPRFLESYFHVPSADFANHLYIYENNQAIEHLFRVACGLDSMIIGEPQILGQVRDAFLLAQQEKATGSLFNRLFKQAITLAKRAHSETSIAENPISVSYAAVELGKQIFGNFKNKKVMIIGAGKMSELTVKHLHTLGAEQVIVTNRTYSRAVDLASRFQGIPCPMDQLQETLTEVDIVISSTDARGLILSRQQLEGTMRNRKSRPLFMIDIAVPRDLDPQISELANVFLYNIDDLQQIVNNNLQERSKEAIKIDRMIGLEIETYEQWFKTLGVGPVIQALQEKATSIHEETMESLFKKLPALDEREMKVIRKLTKSVVNQILHDPINRIKEMSAERHGDEALDLFTRIFALEEKLALTNTEEQIVPVEQKQEMQPLVHSRFVSPILP